MADEDVLLELELEAEPGSVTLARERTRRALDPVPELSETDRVDLELLISELVSNAVKHGRPEPFTVRVLGHPEAVRLCVTNAGRSFSPSAERPRNGGGFGFMMIRALCSRWGVEPSGRNVTVWVEYRHR